MSYAFKNYIENPPNVIVSQLIHPPQFLWRIHHIFYQLMYSNSMPRKSKMPQLLTLKQTSELLNVHPNTLRQWDEKGVLKAVRIGVRRDRRYHREDVMKIMEKSK